MVQKWVPKMEPWQMDSRTKTYGPIPGGLILTHTHISHPACPSSFSRPPASFGHWGSELEASAARSPSTPTASSLSWSTGRSCRTTNPFFFSLDALPSATGARSSWSFRVFARWRHGSEPSEVCARHPFSLLSLSNTLRGCSFRSVSAASLGVAEYACDTGSQYLNIQHPAKHKGPGQRATCWTRFASCTILSCWLSFCDAG